ncbi:MAG: hypothetical protein AB7G80_06500 [Dongiaceae bacterium]
MIDTLDDFMLSKAILQNRQWPPLALTAQVHAAMEEAVKTLSIRTLAEIWDNNKTAQYTLARPRFSHINTPMCMSAVAEIWAHPMYPPVSRPLKKEEDIEEWKHYRDFVQNALFISRIKPDPDNLDTNPPYGLCHVLHPLKQIPVFIMAEIYGIENTLKPKLLFMNAEGRIPYGTGWKPVIPHDNDPKNIIEIPGVFIPDAGFEYLDNFIMQLFVHEEENLADSNALLI